MHLSDSRHVVKNLHKTLAEIEGQMQECPDDHSLLELRRIMQDRITELEHESARSNEPLQSNKHQDARAPR